MIESDDNQLMLGVKAGNKENLGLLFEKYKQPLFGFFFRMTREQEISEDLVQNVFMRILKYSYSYKGDGKFTTWFYHLARNVLADHYQKNKRYQPMGDNGFENRLSHQEHAEAVMAKNQEQELLRLAMAQLSIEKYELLMLVKFQKLRYEEAAVIVGCSEGALKVRVHRIVQELKTIYKRLDQ